MTEAGGSITVEVCYALPGDQVIRSLQIAPGTTALEAVKRSGLAEAFPGHAILDADMGIFSQPLDGKLRPLPTDCVLQAGDRVEIYRPLVIDPKQARLARAAKSTADRKT